MHEQICISGHRHIYARAVISVIMYVYMRASYAYSYLNIALSSGGRYYSEVESSGFKRNRIPLTTLSIKYITALYVVSYFSACVLLFHQNSHSQQCLFVMHNDLVNQCWRKRRPRPKIFIQSFSVACSSSLLWALLVESLLCLHLTNQFLRGRSDSSCIKISITF